MSGVNLQERTASVGLPAVQLTERGCAALCKCHVHVIHAKRMLVKSIGAVFQVDSKCFIIYSVYSGLKRDAPLKRGTIYKVKRSLN